MHDTVKDFVNRALALSFVEGRSVLEVGSYNVNGSIRPYVETLDPSKYVGVDAQAGPGVDRLCDCEFLCETMGSDWDIVISTEMLEHVHDWRICILEMSRAIKPGGLLLITTRSPGFPYHPYPVDNWRFTHQNMEDIARELQLEILMLEDDPEPGVFLLAHKPLREEVPDYDKVGLWAIDVKRVER